MLSQSPIYWKGETWICNNFLYCRTEMEPRCTIKRGTVAYSEKCLVHDMCAPKHTVASPSSEVWMCPASQLVIQIHKISPVLFYFLTDPKDSSIAACMPVMHLYSFAVILPCYIVTKKTDDVFSSSDDAQKDSSLI